MTPVTATFEEACNDAVGRLQAAFVELFDSVQADPHSPQDVSRRFSLNKTLTWNISRLIQSPGGLAAVTHIPGRMAIEKMLKATSRDGANDAAVDGVRAAADAFEQLVEVHLGDRSTLDLVLDGVETPTSDGFELSRKLAFRGNSGLYGVQAKSKLVSSFLAPNADDPDRLDMAMVIGYAGFRRLRSSARWPLFKPRSWATDDEPIAEETWQPIVPPANGRRDGLHLLPEFSEGSLPEMEVVENATSCDVMLKPGPIGNPGAFDCYRGEFLRSAAGRYRTRNEDYGEFGASITSPMEHVVIDIIAHEDLDFALRPEAVVFGRLFPHGEHGTDQDYLLLPIKQSVVALPGRPPAVATPLVPRYAEMVQTVYDSLGWNPSQFRGVRMQMLYPPFGATVNLRFPLPETP
jgi:hypothetical protein